MSKNDKPGASAPSAAGVGGAMPQIPQGYQEQSADIVGFWDNELSRTIHFVPLEVKVFDSQLEAIKPSVLIEGRLVDAATLALPKDRGTVSAKSGELVGVWYKPGMKALKNLAGVSVFMFEHGELQTGKPNP